MKFSLLIFIIFELEIFLIFTNADSIAIKVQPSIYKTLEEKGVVHLLVSFKESDLASVRNAATSRIFSSKADLVTSMYRALKDHATSKQANVIDMLSRITSNSMEVTSFWITNQVGVRGADSIVMDKLLAMPEVAEITEEQSFKTDLPKQNIELVSEPLVEVQWGVFAIGAPQVWATGNRGAGIVVAGIDSGVQGTHEALREGLRSENGWYDAVYNNPVPNDGHGHGTHTMGTIVGRLHGIGVAPEAQWIACKASSDNGAMDYFYFLRCAEFIICPTDPNGDNPRCDLSPDVVNNSWGNTVDIPFYDDIIAAWIKAGITPVFAAGNSGEACHTVGSPGTHPDVISVGSINPGCIVSTFSSRGPSEHYKTIQPDVAAPGESILSAIPTDEKYQKYSGTSMAAPHVSGIVALLKSKKNDLTVAQLKKMIIAGAKPVIPQYVSCGEKPDSEYPNNHVGYGRVNASASLEAVDHLDNSSQSRYLTFLRVEFALFYLIFYGISKALTI